MLIQNSSEIRRTIYAITLNQKISAQKPEVITPAGIIAGTNKISLHGQSGDKGKDTNYYAYSRGKLQQICGTAAEAIRLTYDDVGTVVYGDGNYVLRRGYRAADGIQIEIPAVTASSKENSMAACLETVVKMTGASVNAAEMLAAGWKPEEILQEKMSGNAYDLTGCGLEQVLYYYLSCGYPLIARTRDQGAVLITGYGYKDLYIYSPVTGEQTSMEIEAAARYFGESDCVFIGYLP